MTLISYATYLDVLRDSLNTQFGGSSLTVVIDPRYTPYTDKVLYVTLEEPVIEYRKIDARTPTHQIYQVWYSAKIVGINYITDASLEGSTMGVTGKTGIVSMMESVFTHLSGNFLELASVREIQVEWGNPALFYVPIGMGEEPSDFAAAGEIIHRVRFRDLESEERQASPPALTGVASSGLTMTTVTITWTTDKPSTSLVVYGTDSGNLNLSSAHNTALVTSHSVTLTGLTAGTVYYLKPRSRSAVEWWGTTAEKYTFTTPTGIGGEDGKILEPYTT
jgi:hypothetical protein